MKLFSLDSEITFRDSVSTFSPQYNTLSENINKAEVRCIWINYNELSTNENDADKYREKIDIMFSEIASNDLNVAFVQVRPFADAFYKSEYFPATKYICGGKASFDPLSIICETANKYDISVHAWINPYRVSYDTSDSMDELMIKTESGIFYNPGNSDVNYLIRSGVRELIENYDIDGIHIDDYFYPTDMGNADSDTYKAYTKNGGTLDISAWRRSNINTMLRYIYETLKSVDTSLILSISPCADINKNYSTLYADVYAWCGNKGYADWIIPQIYFGYENESMPFTATLEAWENLVKNDSVKLIIGLPGYKIGKVDEYAGTGKNEFLTDGAGIIKKQISEVSKREACYGYSIYSYSSLEKMS